MRPTRPTRPAVAREDATIERFTKAVLRTTLWVLPIVFLIEWLPQLAAGNPGNLPRWYTYLVFWGTAVVVSRMRKPNALLLLGPGIGYLAVTTILEATVAEDIGGAEAGTALPLLVGLGVVVGAVTTRGFVPVIAGLCAATAAAALFTGIEENLGAADLTIRVVSPVLVLGLAAWILRKLRRDLVATADQTEAAVDARDRLVAAVSHELRTPLAGIVGLAEELSVRRDRHTEAELDEFTAVIAEQGREMADIIDDLLVAARVDAESLIVDIGRVDLRSELDRVLKNPRFADQVELGRIRVEGCGVEARADALRCRQILKNLVSNAIRYGGDEIVIAVSATGDAANVSVADNGSTLSAEDAERVFDPYFSEHNVRTMPGAVGLGLPVSRRLARVMGGDVVCVPGEGRVVFRLSLPRVPDLRVVPSLPG